MESPIEEIKKKVDIITFLNSYISLKKSGRNYKALCPFHQEKTPSFVVSPDRQIWHCFGACQEGGDVIKFLMKWENITFIEALRELAGKSGVKLTNIQFEDKFWKKKERLISINLLAKEFFEFIFYKTRFGDNAKAYLKKRNLDPKIIKKFNIGYAPSSWDSLLKFLKRKKYSKDEIMESGLVVKSERGSIYDRFRGRIIFPIMDARDNIIGFSGRLLGDTKNEAKYINTPETLLYHKRETLYGINLAKEAIKKENNIFIVEGELDVISPFQLGIENIVAIKGSAVTREQLMFLKRYTTRITLALDSDLAGEEAMKKGIEEAENLEFDIKVVHFDFAKDPDEAVRNDPIKFKEAIKDPIPFYDFIINLSQKRNPRSDPYSKKKIAEDVVIFIEKIKNPIVRSHYIKKLALILEVTENSIEALIRDMRRKKLQRFTVSSIKKSRSEIVREIIIQKYLLSIIFQNEDPFQKAAKIFEIFKTEDLNIPAYQKICQFLFRYKEKNDEFHLTNFVNLLPAELKSVFDEIYLFASSDSDAKNEKIEKLVYEAKRYSLKRRISELLSSENKDETETRNNLIVVNKELTYVEKMIVSL